MIAAAPKIWPRRPFCALTADSPSGARMRSFPPGSSRWRRTSIVRSCVASRRGRCRSKRLPNLRIRAPLTQGKKTRDYDRDLAVRRAVGALPAKYREALTLFYFHDMDVATAARSLGLPEGTVKARLFRGREILRSKLPQLLAVPHLKEA